MIRLGWKKMVTTFGVLAALAVGMMLIVAPMRAQEHGTAAHAAATHSEAAHDAESHEKAHDPVDEAIHTAENSSFLDIALRAGGYHASEEVKPEGERTLLDWIAIFQPAILSAIVIFILMAFLVAGAKKREMVPGHHQNLVELLVGGFDEFIEQILGIEGRTFLPFLGTLFLYIWISNLIGLFPFFKAPTSSFNTTAALALVVFLYVNYVGIRRNGIKGYIFHLAGEPRDVIGWAMVPLLFPLHLIGELAKPMSLSLRLFGNIFGEETIIAVFIGLGIGALSFLPIHVVGLPFQVPFMFLGLLTSTIQALVFTLLSSIYFSLMLPHHEHHHDGEHAEAHH